MRVFQRVLILVVLAVAAAPMAGQEQKAAATKAAAMKTQAAKPAETREPGLYMTFQTEKGSITCKLYEKETPVTTSMIVGLAVGKIGGKPFYDGLIFHRVIPEFMIQGGDPQGTGMGSPRFPGFPFKDEFVSTLQVNVAGRLAMANSGLNTNGSQFFITEDTPAHLNNHRPIVGRIGKLDTVEALD